MATNETTQVRGGGIVAFLNGLLILLAIVVIVGIALHTFLPGMTITPPTIIIATAEVKQQPSARPVVDPRPRPVQQQPAQQPAVDQVQADIDRYNAEQEALAQQALQAAPVQNVDQHPADAPMPQYGEKEVPAREPAGEVVPTSLPIQPAAVNDQFGSKPSKPVDIQGTKTCLHGQIWVDGRGCKNPTPVK